MKKRLSALLLLSSILGFAAPLVHAQDATAYAVADASSCHILDARNIDKKLPIASLAKIATAMVVLDWLDVSKRDQGSLATVPPGAIALEPTNPIGFQAGDQVSIRDLLYATLIQSDNIAAYTLADHIGRDLQRSFQSDARPVDLFVAQMNALARKLNMKRTVFLNPHGLDLGENPRSTAQDLVLLSSAAMQRSAFRFYVSQHQRQISRVTAGGASVSANLVNTNELLGIDAIDGVKSGKSARSGECVVISAARAPESVQIAEGQFKITPRRLIVVVLGSRNGFNDARQLLNNGWNLYDEWAAQGRPLEK